MATNICESRVYLSDTLEIIGGIVSLSSKRKIKVTGSDNNSDKTIEIVGTNSDGEAQSEIITAPNSSTVTSNSYFKTITSVQSSEILSGTISVKST